MNSRVKPERQRRRLRGDIEGTISTTTKAELIIPKAGCEIAIWAKEFYFWMIRHAP
jgi:hypothetical protein